MRKKLQITEKEKEEFKNITQKEIILEYYSMHKNENVLHKDVVDWATKEYKNRTGKVFRDPDRCIRVLYQEGKLIKIDKGVYKYDENLMGVNKTLYPFTQEQKEMILKNGGYKCAVCGLSKNDGVELHIDHIIPLDKGGTNDITNGQILCSRHNIYKKNYSGTETGKRLFVNMYQLLLETEQDDETKKMLAFLEDLLDVYKKHNVNGHIKFDKKKK